MSGNNDGVQAELLKPQVFKIELIIDRIEIDKGPHKNFIPAKSSPVDSPPVLRSLTGSGKRSRTSSRGSKKSKKSKSGSKSPKTPTGKKSPKGKKGKKSKKGSKKQDASKAAVDAPPVEDKLDGNRKEIPPLRVGIDIFSLKDVFVTQIDVDERPVDDFEPINELSSTEYETETEGTSVPPTVPVTLAGEVEGSEQVEGPVDPVKLSEALVKVQRDEKKHGKRLTKRESETDVAPSRKGSMKSSASKKKSSKRDSKKSSKSKKEKEQKGKKKSAKTKKPDYILKKIPDPDARPPSRAKDTWSIASERAFKRGTALMFTETPANLIAAMQGAYVTLRVDRFGGKEYHDGASDPVGYLRVQFPSNWLEAIVQVNSQENPPKELPLTSPLTLTNPLVDEQGQEIGFVSLAMAIHCYKDSIVSQMFPSESTLYDVLNSNALDELNNSSRVKSQTIPQYYDVHPRAKKMNYTQLFNM